MTAFLSRYWYVVLIVAVIGLGAGLRLWDLGDRAIHHDESIHIKFAYDIKEQGLTSNGNATYTHDPVYHGPLQYFAIATVFRIFGDSNYTSRLAPALFGIALVGLPFLLRKQLGLLGMFLAAGLLAVSPVILYVSRFAREDMYVVFFTLAMAVCMWRYVSDRPEDEEDAPFPSTSEEFGAQASTFFSYVGQKHNLWLIAIAPLMALSFATKEITPITVAIFLIFINFMIAWDLFEQFKASRTLSSFDALLAYTAFVLTGWLIAALWPLTEDTRKQFGLTKTPAAVPLMLIFGTMAAPQFSAAIQKAPFITDKGYMMEAGLMHVIVLGLIIFTAAVGLIWNWRIWLAAGLLFYIPFVLLFTGFFTNPAGFWTGIWGSMDYWLSQQHVRRGDQPDYYYFMLTPVYEFLPLIFGLAGVLYSAFRGRLEQKLLSASAVLLIFVLSIIPGDLSFLYLGKVHIHLAFLVAIATVLLISMDTFTKFLIFWALAIAYGLTAAGEKMPWLTVHLALPLSILAAKVLNDTLSSFPETLEAAKKKAGEAVSGSSPWVLLGMTGVLAFGAALIFQYYGPVSGPGVLAWLLSLGAAAIVVWMASQVSWQAAGQVAVVGLFAAMLVFTIRAAGNAAYDQGDIDGYPRELLIYAQGSPKLGVIASEIDRIADESGLGNDLKIYIDNTGNIWPWPWYLRGYRNVEYTTYENVVPQPGSVVLVSDPNQGRIQPYLDQYQQPVPYVHMWWFLPDHYRGIDQMQVLGDIFNGHYFPIWRDYFIDRTVPGAVQGVDMFAYFPKDFPTNVPTDDSPVAGAAAGTPLPPAAIEALARHGIGEGEVNGPADVTVDSEGNVYVIDGLNHRIVKFTPDGEFSSMGNAGSGEGEFADPYVEGQYENHDGPWGIAADDDGNVYVADTWNHRIQKFNSDLEFQLEWGTGDLFGPRDLAVHSDGSILVVDTGNKRIRKYDPNGLLIADYGSAGDGPGQFDEPSSISVAPNGDIFVADYWNQRIQRFNPNFEYIDEISMPTWGSHGITDRAYITVLADGHILATDPANGRIAVLTATGDVVGSWRVAETGAASRPIGIATDGTGRVYITDAAATGGQAVGPDDPAGALFAVDLEALLAAPPVEATP
jgi:uncharacterized protein (TIGR03663 family)